MWVATGWCLSSTYLAVLFPEEGQLGLESPATKGGGKVQGGREEGGGREGGEVGQEAEVLKTAGNMIASEAQDCQSDQLADGIGEGGQLIVAEVQDCQSDQLADGIGEGGQLIVVEVQVCHPPLSVSLDIARIDECLPLPPFTTTLAVVLEDVL